MNRHKEGVYLSKNINLCWVQVLACFVGAKYSFYIYARAVVEKKLFLLMLLCQVPIPTIARGGKQQGR